MDTATPSKARLGFSAVKRPAVLVLLLTFVALVAATLWVPARRSFQFDADVSLADALNAYGLDFDASGKDDASYRFIWEATVRDEPIEVRVLAPAASVGPERTVRGRWGYWVAWGQVLLELILIASVGGLAALVIRLRAARAGAAP